MVLLPKYVPNKSRNLIKTLVISYPKTLFLVRVVTISQTVVMMSKMTIVFVKNLYMV